jgi:hypothetical protein
MLIFNGIDKHVSVNLFFYGNEAINLNKLMMVSSVKQT